MVLMTSKTSLQKWSEVFLFPSVSPVFFQIGTVTYQHRLRFRWRGFMYEFLPLIRKARTRCDLTGFHLAARSAQVLSLGRLACWRSSRPGARGLSARFHTLSLPVTDTLSKMGRLSVKLSEILDRLVEQTAFNSIQEENGTFFKPLLSIQALKASCGNNSANQAQDASLCTDQHRQAAGFV